MQTAEVKLLKSHHTLVNSNAGQMNTLFENVIHF